jgi:hypothetical protein
MRYCAFSWNVLTNPVFLGWFDDTGHAMRKPRAILNLQMIASLGAEAHQWEDLI